MKTLLVASFLIFFLSRSYGDTVRPSTQGEDSPSDHTLIVLDKIYKEAGGNLSIDGLRREVSQNIAKKTTPKIIKPSPKVNKIPPSPPPQVKKIVPIKKKPSRNLFPNKKLSGAEYVKRMREKNRRLLKNIQQKEKTNQISNNTKSSDSIYDLKRKAREGLNKLKLRNRQTLSKWKNKTQETYKRWKEKQKKFLENLKYYKKNTFDLEEAFSSAGDPKYLNMANNKLSKDGPVELSNRALKKIHIIKNAIDVPIRDQGRRPTCAAFAGIRAIEILLASSEKYKYDLSEQYLYWASKPKCQQRPCASRGSWPTYAYNRSKESALPDIPLEQTCPYNNKSISGNETQIPLKNSCNNQGVVKISHYSRIHSFHRVVNNLNKNLPIIGGFKLSPNFYRNKGLITYADRNLKGKMNSHSGGHAILIIGHMELPAKYHRTEGTRCLIIANSWTEGWGAGGYACITQKWFENYVSTNALIAVESLKL